MSGGKFDYWQNNIEYMVEKIIEVIQKSGKEVPERFCDYYMRDHKYARMCQTFDEETLKRFEEGIFVLKLAYIYLQRIDWLCCCDDGEEEFHKRLKEEIEQLEKESKLRENGMRYIPVDRDVDPWADSD